MDFSLPFPTLKHLAMVCIGKVTLDKEIRPMAKLWERNNDGAWIYNLELTKIMTALPIPAHFKDALSDVIAGMFCQMSPNLTSYKCIKNVKELELLYDVYGKLDVATMLRRYFEREVSNCDTLETLLNLLQSTIKEKCWYGIDAILSRLLSLHCPNVKLLKGKLDVICRVNAMVYNLDDSLTKQDASKVISRLKRLFRHHNKIKVSKVGLYVPVNAYCLDYQFLVDHFKKSLCSNNHEEKLAFLSGAMFNRWFNETCVLDILRTLDHETQHECFTVISILQCVVSSNTSVKVNFFYGLLNKFLEWPLTPLFMPFLEIANPYLSTHNYFVLLDHIEEKIPKRGCFGDLYVNLLAKYWEAIPSRVKEDFRARGTNLDGCDHKTALQLDLKSLYEKNMFLFAKISTEMWPEETEM